MPFQESFFNEIRSMTTTKEPRIMTKDILNKFITEANKLNDKDKDWFIREVEKHRLTQTNQAKTIQKSWKKYASQFSARTKLSKTLLN